MKISTKRRLLSLLLAFVMVLALAPTALLVPPDGGTTGGGTTTTPDPDNPDPDDPDDPDSTPSEGVLTDLRLSCDSWDSANTSPPRYALILEPGADKDKGGVRVDTILEPIKDDKVQQLHVAWSPTNSSIVGVSESEEGHTGYLFGKAPGKEKITVSAG